MTADPDRFGATVSGRSDGPSVVLVHGALDRSTGMARLARRLGDTTHVMRYDRRGYGRAVDLPGPFTLEVHAADLLALVSAVFPEQPVVLFGHSYGAHVVLRAASDRPDLVAAVAVYEPPMSWEQWWAAGRAPRPTPVDPADAAEAFMRRMAGDRVWERLPQATRDARRAEGPAFVEEGSDLRRGRPWDPARVTCEVRVAHGGATGEHFVRAAHEIAAMFGVEPVVLPDAGHGAHLNAAEHLASEVVLPLRALSTTDLTSPP